MQAKSTRDLLTSDARAEPRRAARPGHPRARRQSAANAAPARRQRAAKTARSAPYRVLATALCLTAVVIATMAATRFSARGEVFRGVAVHGAPVGGLSAAAARAEIERIAADFSSLPLTLTHGDRRWTRTFGELGFSIDAAATTARALAYGRDHDRLAAAAGQLGVGNPRSAAPLQIRIDAAMFGAVLESLAAEAAIAPIDAGVVLIGGAVAINPARDGAEFDVERVRASVLAAIDRPAPVAIELATRPVAAAVQAGDVEPLLPEIAAALNEPMVFLDEDHRWTLAPEDLAPMVRVRPSVAGQAGQPATIELDDRAVRSLGEQLAISIDETAGQPWIDDSGAMPRLMAAAPARRILLDEFVARVQTAFQNGEREIAIPVDRQASPASVDAFLATLGVTAVLATGTSDFAGSEPGRVTNIEVAAALIDGVMIPPGETFSFNYAIGEINATPGFVPAGASENGIAGTANGGGVCQVTTTIFRAALEAGLPIEEWWPHAYRNVYYEQGGWAPGLDASVQQPDDDPFGGSDFIFRNTTGSWLLVRASIAGGTILTVELLGQPTGLRVELDDPVPANVVSAEGWPEQVSFDPALPPGARELVQPARDGMTTTVTRRVFAADGALIAEDEFVSVYEPQGEVYRTGDDPAGASGDGQ